MLQTKCNYYRRDACQERIRKEFTAQGLGGRVEVLKDWGENDYGRGAFTATPIQSGPHNSYGSLEEHNTSDTNTRPYIGQKDRANWGFTNSAFILEGIGHMLFCVRF